jgi:two-component system chemotaxis response regulator CheY
MEELFIIIIDDQREVLTTVSKDLEELSEYISLEECEAADELLELLDEIDSEGNYAAVIISDHVMPGKNGVQLLTEINEDSRFKDTKKILLTGLATHEDTIHAINQAHIQRYIEKPWDKITLLEIVKELLTRYVLEKGLDQENVKPILDNNILIEYARKGF